MEKKFATRTCIGTGNKDEKRNMLRLVRKQDGQVVVDAKGRERGRGANLSMNLEAFDQAVKKRAIERALKLEYKLSEIQITSLRDDFAQAIEERQLRQGNRKINYKVSQEEFAKISKS